MVKTGLNSGGGAVSPGYFNQYVRNQGSGDITKLFDVPMKALRDKGITPRKVSKLAKEMAMKAYAEQVKKGTGKDN